jgi:RimJ/RimL family protein N-acetyltransferase
MDPPPTMIGGMHDIPLIETERLRLRAHRSSDLADCLALWADPETVRFIGGQVQDAQAVWFRMLRYAGMWALTGYGYWAIEEKATGNYLGEGGLADMCRGMVLLEGVPEIGWALKPQAAGKGFATEAAAAIANWADAALAAPVTRCIIAPDNIGSLRVAHKLDYAEIARIQAQGATLIVLERRIKPG